jgi:hypothetical protein
MSFIPEAFSPPQAVNLQALKLSVLGPQHADLDFKALKSSAGEIRHVFGPQNDWPGSDITYTENLADLVRHEKEFFDRVAFAYSMLDASSQQYVGCLYIKPIKSKKQPDRRKDKYQAQAYFWLTKGQSTITDAQAELLLKSWIDRIWPFSSIAWPGRNPSWDEWMALADA